MRRNTHVMLNHKLPQLLPVDQDDLGFYGLNVLVRRFRIAGGGDEDPLSGFFAQQRPGEVAYLAHGYGILPAFGLNVDDIQPQAVFFDDAVYAAVIGAANSTARIGTGTTAPEPAPLAIFDEQIPAALPGFGRHQLPWRYQMRRYLFL